MGMGFIVPSQKKRDLIGRLFYDEVMK